MVGVLPYSVHMTLCVPKVDVYLKVCVCMPFVLLRWVCALEVFLKVGVCTYPH